MKELQSIARNFTDDRPTLTNNNTHERIIDLLYLEVDEVRDASPDELASELADIVLFTISLANLNDIDLEEATKTKLAFNNSRYISKDFQDGSYEEARLKGKVREIEVKKDFSKI